jgi:TonB family protein
VVEIELRADGTVGDVKIIQPLDPDLDEGAADAARQTIFLPAVKNKEFISTNIRLVMSFNLY